MILAKRHHLRNAVQTSLLTALVLLEMNAPAQSCACCAEPGERHTGTIAIDQYLQQDLALTQLTGPANVFVNNCDMECVVGIKDPQYDYDANLTIADGRWSLTLGKNGVMRGTISFLQPATATQFFVDTAPDQITPSARLYKELRLPVAVTGTGDFAKGLKWPALSEFILIGSGNVCTQPSNFTHWQLTVKSDDADFSLFGRLAPPQ